MASPSPLQARFDDADAQFTAFGHTPIVAMHDVVETEYGRLRAGATVMDGPHRALIQLTGTDRLSFLHNLLSQNVGSMPTGSGARSFLLDAKGHILGDMVVLHDEVRTLLDVDAMDTAGLIAELDKLLFGEDVQIADESAKFHRLSLHGPAVAARLGTSDDDWPAFEQRPVSIGGLEGLAYRDDQCGVPGLHLWLAAEDVAKAWETLTDPQRDDRVRPLGWLAFNIARIEAGTPLYHIDFGPDSLPGETSIADTRISYTKGCYRGQEIVATMKDRGHPSKRLVRFTAEADALPTAGTPITAEDAGDARAVGAVTSSTMSPLKGNAPIGIAMVKWGLHEPGTQLWSPAEGARVRITLGAPTSF